MPSRYWVLAGIFAFFSVSAQSVAATQDIVVGRLIFNSIMMKTDAGSPTPEQIAGWKRFGATQLGTGYVTKPLVIKINGNRVDPARAITAVRIVLQNKRKRWG